MAVDEADTDRDRAIKAPIRSDPFQMAMIHRTFRREFGDLGALILTLPPRDTRRSTFVGNYLEVASIKVVYESDLISGTGVS